MNKNTCPGKKRIKEFPGKVGKANIREVTIPPPLFKHVARKQKLAQSEKVKTCPAIRQAEATNADPASCKENMGNRTSPKHRLQLERILISPAFYFFVIIT